MDLRVVGIPNVERSRLSLQRARISDRGRAQIFRQKIEIRSWILRQPKWPVRPVHEPFSTQRAQQVREMILRWTPDPREIPKHAPLLLRGEAPVHFLDQLTARSSDHQLHALICARERTHM